MSDPYGIRLTGLAQADIAGIVSYIEDELGQREAARALYRKVQGAIASLSERPRRIALVRKARFARRGYRVMRVDNYHVFFVVDEEKKNVLIARVLYARRHWVDLL